VSFRIETIAIGDEILTGKISDTNSTFVANTIFNNGYRLDQQTVIPDVDETIIETLKNLSQRCDVIVCFGGLGPTSDDKTAECVATLLGSDLAQHAPSKAHLERVYRERGREVTASALKQILYPQKARPLPNSTGMAPGFAAEIGKALCFFLPGVPAEMKPMFTDHVLPALRERARSRGVPAGQIFSHVWRCLKIWESELQRVMDPVESELPAGSWLGYRTKFPENHLTLYVRDDGTPKARDTFNHWQKKIREILKPWTYTEADKDLEVLIAEKLGTEKASVALAESCTGGLTVQRLTRIPGSSQRVWGGVVTYQRAAKNTCLGLDLTSDESTVSAECTRQMAEAVRRKSGCKYGAAVTGYLGPTGGTEKDPVGTIYICVVGEKRYEERLTVTLRSREEAQWGAATYLLRLLYSAL